MLFLFILVSRFDIIMANQGMNMQDLKNTKVVNYSNIITIKVEPSTSLLEVSQKMEKNNIRHMPVVLDGEFVGIISDRDIKLIAGMQRAEELQAHDVMHKNLYVIGPEVTLNEGVSNMLNNKLDSILIKDGEKLSIFTSTDVMKIVKTLSE